MTIYLTSAEFRARLDDPAQFDELAAGVLDAALLDANGLAEGYLSAQYPVMDIVPGMLKSLVFDVALRKLYKSDPTDGVRLAAEQALKTLLDISKGTIVLRVLNPPAPDAEDPDGGVFYGSDVRLFTRATLRG
jgi:phage gp36-like protein